MGQEHVVAYRDENDPRIAKIDVNNGYVYDAKGNQIAQWDVVDNSEHTAALADHAWEIATGAGVCAMAAVDRDRAREMAEAAALRLNENSHTLHDVTGEDLIKMDLGPADVHIPSALPNFASGYKNNPPIADMFAPPLLVDKQVDDYYQFAKEDAFQMAKPTVGGGGGAVSEIAPRLSNAQYKAIEYALGGFTTTQVESNSDPALRIKQATVKRVMNALLLAREDRVSTLATTSTNYDSSVVATLSSGFQWNGGASSAPITDLRTRIRKAWGDITGVLMSQDSWDSFLENSGVQKFVTFKDGTKGLPTPAQIQEQFDLPPIYVGRMKYMDATGNLQFFWGDNVVLMRQSPQMPPTDQEDVMTAVTFRWNGTKARDGVVSGGMVVREFYVQDRGSLGGMKCVVLHTDAEVITSKFAAGLIVGAFQ